MTTTTRDLLNQARIVQASYRSSDLDIAELVGKLADELELLGDRHELVQLECLDHEPVQRRDGKTPWCRVCGLDDDGNEPDAATDEQVEAAARATHEANKKFYPRMWQVAWELQDPRDIEGYLDGARAALEAATRVPVQGEPNDDREALVRQERAKLVAVRDILNRDDFGDDWEHDEWVYRQAAEKQLADIEEALGSVMLAVPDAIARVRELHRESEAYPETCVECSVGENLIDWPCRTIAALDGAPEPEWEAVAEYGVKYAPTNNRASYTMRFGYESREDAEHSLGRLGRNQKRNPDRLMYREVRTGPWLPVEGESKP